MKDHILLIADGRSPTTHSWIMTLQELNYQVSLIATFPCEPPAGLQVFHVLPIAFSGFSQKPNTPSEATAKSGGINLIKHFTGFFQTLRYYLGPLSLYYYARPYQRLLQQISPDLVHALRIPFEGMIGSFTPQPIPFLTATWGNDLTLHAKGSGVMRRFTRRCLKRANGLTSDTRRDLRLARQWGLDPNAPTLVVPGSGGVDLDALDKTAPFNRQAFNIPQTGAWVVNPRGMRPGSVHQDVFFTSIPKILVKKPETRFICPGLENNPSALALIQQLGIEKQTFLLPKLPQPQLWALFKASEVFVSPSSHDGTPNTLLEAMACGCFPVVGAIESLREWIDPGVNGLLVDPQDPQQLADGILTALDNPALRHQAAALNLAIIKERASQDATQPRIKDFYTRFLV